jgi:hypothetical protein
VKIIFFLVLLLQKEPLERLRCSWKDNPKMVFKEWDGTVWTGFMWLRIGRSGGLL